MWGAEVPFHAINNSSEVYFSDSSMMCACIGRLPKGSLQVSVRTQLQVPVDPPYALPYTCMRQHRSL
jgi:hypothetical protein